MIENMVHGRISGDSGGQWVKSMKLPPRSLNLNANPERFVRTIEESCLERMIGEGPLRKAVHEFVVHYHRERNHQGLGNRRMIEEEPYAGTDAVAPAAAWNAELQLSSGGLRWRSNLDGIVHHQWPEPLS